MSSSQKKEYTKRFNLLKNYHKENIFQGCLNYSFRKILKNIYCLLSKKSIKFTRINEQFTKKEYTKKLNLL